MDRFYFCMPKFNDDFESWFFNVTSKPQRWMKILKTANSKFRVYKMQQQLLLAAGNRMCNTLTRQNPTFTNTCKQETTALTKSSWMLPVQIGLAQEREGGLQSWLVQPWSTAKQAKTDLITCSHLCCLFMLEMVLCWVCTLRVHLQALEEVRIVYFSPVFIINLGPIFPSPSTLQGWIWHVIWSKLCYISDLLAAVFVEQTSK